MIKDEMENSWGVEYYSSPPHKARKTLHNLDRLVRSSVSGYKLKSLAPSGTEANMEAILVATGYDGTKALYGLGNYVGGSKYTQELSTSMYDATSLVALPRRVENASDSCKKQTVPLPYHCPGSAQFSEEKLIEWESQCIQSLHKKLFVAKFKGQPYKCLLLELLLSGCGCELSSRFLKNLGKLCNAFSITIIADEILTAGRAGPALAMTPSQPEEFVQEVQFITVGKFTGCGIVLEKIPNKPTRHEDKLRGTSTSLEASEAYALWAKTMESISNGAIEARRNEVLKIFKYPELEKVWGKGTIVFCTIARHGTTRALKCRNLPKLEPGLAILKGRCGNSKWNRSTVTLEVYETCQNWLIFQENSYKRVCSEAFLSPLFDFLFHVSRYRVAENVVHNGKTGQYIRFRPEEVVEFIGPQAATDLVTCIQAVKLEGGFKCKKSALSFTQDVIIRAYQHTPDEGNFLKQRKTSNRVEFTFAKASLFLDIERVPVSLKSHQHPESPTTVTASI